MAGGSPGFQVAGPVPVPEYLYLIPDGRDPGPETASTRHPPPEAATCNPRMNELGQHAVLPLPDADSRLPMAVGRTAVSRMADAPVAVTCHPVVRMRMRCHRIPTRICPPPAT